MNVVSKTTTKIFYRYNAQHIVEIFLCNFCKYQKTFWFLGIRKISFLLQRCFFYKSAVSSKNIPFVVIFDCRACYLRVFKLIFPPAAAFKIENIFAIEITKISKNGWRYLRMAPILKNIFFFGNTIIILSHMLDRFLVV